MTAGSGHTAPEPAVTAPGGGTPGNKKSVMVDKPQPYSDVLLEIALKKRRSDEILRWYDRLRASRSERWGRWLGVYDDLRVADAVAATTPTDP